MNKITSIIATCAAAVTLSSCGGVGLIDYISCIFSPNLEECLAVKAVEGFTNSLESLIGGMNTLEEAQKVSVIMAKLRNAINTAERLGLEIPLKVKKVYNDALSRIQRHNYFGSEALQAALDGAYPL